MNLHIITTVRGKKKKNSVEHNIEPSTQSISLKNKAQKILINIGQG